MIIQCPACATRYVVPDTAMGVDGRTVRCAKCRHSWFQDGPQIDVPQEEGAPVAARVPPASPPSPAPPPAPPPRAPEPEPEAEPEAEPQAASPAPAPAPTPTPASPPPAPIDREEIPPPPTVRVSADEGADMPSHFDREPPFRRRRNPLKMWTWAAAIFAIVAAGMIFAVSYWGLPDWVPVERPTFAASDPDLQLDFPPDQQERRTLPNGTEYFSATGSITNIGTRTREIPSILIVLRDSRDRKVYEWVVPPPQRTIAPGENVLVSEAMTDIPRSAREVQIGWKPE